MRRQEFLRDEYMKTIFHVKGYRKCIIPDGREMKKYD
jgi:hypothetical protein